MSAIQLSATRCAALAIIARPKNDSDEATKYTLKTSTEVGSITVDVPAKHPGGGTIAEMCKAGGWAEGSAKGTIPVYRSFGIPVTMTKDEGNIARYHARVPDGLQIMNTGRGHFLHGTKPIASDVSVLPGNPGNTAVEAAAAEANKAIEAAAEATEEPAVEAQAEEPVAEMKPEAAEAVTHEAEPETQVDPALAAKAKAILERREAKRGHK